MIIKHFFTPELSINSYLVYDEKEKVGVMIDPARNISSYLEFANQEKIKITDICETHVHADFMSGASELKLVLGEQVKIRCSGMGGKKWIPAYADIIVKDKDEFFVGNIKFKALYTPGHTLEHICWQVFDQTASSQVNSLFSGDLLFLGSIGRPDLLGSESMQGLVKMLYHSIFEVIYPLDDSTKVYPSHGAGSLCGKKINAGVSSTIGYEKLNNYGLEHLSFEEWKKILMQDLPQVPGYFKPMKSMNLKGSEIQNKVFQELQKSHIDEALKSHIFIDIRDPVTFAKGSFKDSLNIPFGPSFASWAGSVLPMNSKILLVANHPKDIMPAIHALKLIGLDHDLNYFSLEQLNETEKSHYFSPKPLIDVNTLFKNINSYFILDVRTKKEWDLSHISSAHLIPLSDLTKEIFSLPKDKTIAVICHSGNRASVAASLISKELDISAINVNGGMQAWTNQALPTIKP